MDLMDLIFNKYKKILYCVEISDRSKQTIHQECTDEKNRFVSETVLQTEFGNYPDDYKTILYDGKERPHKYKDFEPVKKCKVIKTTDIYNTDIIYRDCTNLRNHKRNRQLIIMKAFDACTMRSDDRIPKNIRKMYDRLIKDHF